MTARPVRAKRFGGIHNNRKEPSLRFSDHQLLRAAWKVTGEVLNHG
jgi:hypothetical protein